MARRNPPAAINLEPDIQMTNKFETLSLIGKLMLNKTLTKDLVKSTTTAQWKCQNPFSVSNIDNNNMFMFMFQDKHDMNKVFLESPWLIHGGLLILSPWCSTKVPKERNLCFSPFWVQVHGLPLHYQTEKNGFKIGETFLGRFISVDRNSLGCGGSGGTGEIVWRKFIRIRVVLDVGMPLRTGFWLRRNGMPNIWIFFKYEKLGLFCYKCGRIGHAQRVCNNPARSINFGPWLCAVSVGNGSPEHNSSCSRAGPSVVNRSRDVRVSGDVTPDCPVESPAKLSLMVELCPEMDNAKEHYQAVDIPHRYLWGKLLINGIDTMAMVMNNMIICTHVTYANVLEPNWRLFLMMAGYLIYMVFKLSREIRQFRACNVRVPLTELSISALVEVFIFIILFLILFSAA